MGIKIVNMKADTRMDRVNWYGKEYDPFKEYAVTINFRTKNKKFKIYFGKVK